jgi:hypothetical protein
MRLVTFTFQVTDLQFPSLIEAIDPVISDYGLELFHMSSTPETEDQYLDRISWEQQNGSTFTHESH